MEVSQTPTELPWRGTFGQFYRSFVGPQELEWIKCKLRSSNISMFLVVWSLVCTPSFAATIQYMSSTGVNPKLQLKQEWEHQINNIKGQDTRFNPWFSTKRGINTKACTHCWGSHKGFGSPPTLLSSQANRKAQAWGFVPLASRGWYKPLVLNYNVGSSQVTPSRRGANL